MPKLYLQRVNKESILNCNYARPLSLHFLKDFTILSFVCVWVCMSVCVSGSVGVQYVPDGVCVCVRVFVIFGVVAMLTAPSA